MNRIATANKAPPNVDPGCQYPAPANLSAVGGSANDAWNRNLAAQLLATIKRTGSRPEADTRRETAALIGLIGVKPTDEIEAMLAAQLVATHNAAMDAFNRAAATTAEPEANREALNQATRLSRAYAALLEALSRYRGKGQQTVRVEHVHVHAGGQAVVGNIEAPRVGGASKSEEQGHAQPPHA